MRRGLCWAIEENMGSVHSQSHRQHEVWMNGKPGSVRVVLLIRFWHPDIPPARWPEAHHHMRRLLVQHKRRLSVPPLQRASPHERAAPALMQRGDE